MPKTIHPAHNDPSEKPVPLKEIRESTCINCNHEMKIDDLITYTRLHNKKVIWWHRRKNQDDPDPCRLENKPQLCGTCNGTLEKKRKSKSKHPYICQKCKKEKLRKNAYERYKSLREQKLKSTTPLADPVVVEP